MQLQVQVHYVEPIVRLYNYFYLLTWTKQTWHMTEYHHLYFNPDKDLTCLLPSAFWALISIFSFKNVPFNYGSTIFNYQ